MKILLLEDDYNRVEMFQKRVTELNERNTHREPYEIVHAETVEQFKSAMQSSEFNLILLDHDLGGEIYVDINRDDTGSGAARWIKQTYGDIHPTVLTHTLNQTGADNILELIKGSIHIPFLWMKEVFHAAIK